MTAVKITVKSRSNALVIHWLSIGCGHWLHWLLVTVRHMHWLYHTLCIWLPIGYPHWLYIGYTLVVNWLKMEITNV